MVYPIFAGIGAVLLRNFTGWAKKSLADGKVQKYEWRQLWMTTLKSGLLFVTAYYGFGMEELFSAGIAIVGEIVWNKIDQMVKFE